MKKILIFIMFLGFISCSTLTNKTDITPEEMEFTPGNKAGIVILNNGTEIYFKCSHVFLDRKIIRINSEDSRQTILWKNVRTIHIYNSCSQEDYIKKLKEIEKKKEGK